ncbi:histidinol-phosphate transaminase [Sporolactobacillus sp. THM7-7]|nr:histidinol-phosphate transaminase [Sporolactobacillus sp. THM7-7]
MFKPHLSRLKAYEPGPSIKEIKKAYGLDRLIKLDANENVYGASPKVGEAIAKSALLPSLYPDSTDGDVRGELARLLGARPGQFLFGCGLDEIIALVSRALLSPGDNIVMAWPTFYEYHNHAQIQGAETKKVPCDANGRHDLKGMLDAIDSHTRMVWICNPNNPTGTYVHAAELADFLRQVPQDVAVLLDEAYIDFVDAKDFPHSLDLLAAYPNLLVMRTFSKSYGLASFRIGYAIGQERLIQELNKVRPPFNTTRLSQIAAYAALKDQSFIKACIRKNHEVRKMMTAFFDKRQIPYYPSQTNFIYIKTENPQVIVEQCRRKGFLIQGFQDGVRVTIGKMSDMQDFLHVIEDCLSDAPAEPKV